MKQLWFVIGSQHLYGDETIKQVAVHAQEMSEYFNEKLPYKVVLKPVATTADIITSIMKEANASDECIGIITWMHTFSPSKMWITGLNIIEKPIFGAGKRYNDYGLGFYCTDSLEMAKEWGVNFERDGYANCYEFNDGSLSILDLNSED